MTPSTLAERETRRLYWFTVLAFTFYTGVKVCGLLCATLIIFSGLPDALPVGSLLFVITLVAPFGFHPPRRAHKEN